VIKYKYKDVVEMPTYPTSTEIINGSSLVKGKAYIQNVKFKDSDRTLIKGTVYDINGNPLDGVGVEVIQIDSSSIIPVLTVLGAVFSEADGVYAVSVEVKEEFEYILNIYNPLPL
jgi:hypothetical protein